MTSGKLIERFVGIKSATPAEQADIVQMVVEQQSPQVIDQVRRTIETDDLISLDADDVSLLRYALLAVWATDITRAESPYYRQSCQQDLDRLIERLELNPAIVRHLRRYSQQFESVLISE